MTENQINNKVDKQKKKRLRKLFAKRRPTVLRSLIMRDKRVCGICKTKILENETCTIDHIIPLSRGGTNEFQNFQLAHEKCNSVKGGFILTSMKDQHRYNYALKNAMGQING